MSDTATQIPPQVFRATHAREGWTEIFSPESGAMRFLSYARFRCGAQGSSHTLETGGKEYALFCIIPEITVSVGGQEFRLDEHDLLYIPRNSRAEIKGAPGADVVVSGSDAHIDSAPQLVRFEDIRHDPEYFFDVGTEELGTKRRIYNMLGHNVKASRLLAGFTVGAPGAWTSWPPHEHSTTKEEFYLFFDMPKPAFSVQFVYDSPEEPGFSEVVRDGDCVTIPGGYHPTAAAPGHSSVFLWVMAGFNPERDRDFKHGITIQPEFQTIKFV